MITAIDTSVLLDIFLADPAFGPASREAVRSCRAEGGLIACDVVWAEVGAAFGSVPAAAAALERLHVGFSPLDAAAALDAGRAFKEYRDRGGTRHRVIPDFMVGAHARSRAQRLLTRDRGFYRRAFDDVVILDPSA